MSQLKIGKGWIIGKKKVLREMGKTFWECPNREKAIGNDIEKTETIFDNLEVKEVFLVGGVQGSTKKMKHSKSLDFCSVVSTFLNYSVCEIRDKLPKSVYTLVNNFYKYLHSCIAAGKLGNDFSSPVSVESEVKQGSVLLPVK